MKFLLVGPGLMSLPPIGWGACEVILYEYYTRLTKLGHEVQFTNTNNINEIINEVNSCDKDTIIEVMYDDYIGHVAQYSNKPILGQYHYGYINRPEKWSGGYFPIYRGILKADGLLHLSKANAAQAKGVGFDGFSRVLRNGCSIEAIKYSSDPSNETICLSKIESRKGQAKLAEMMNGRMNIDFVGPIADSSFKENKTCRYLGSWSREEVSEKLTDYKTLILLSEGENDSLIVKEALAAGCSLVISEYCIANLDITRPYISVLCENDIADANRVEYELQQSIANNKNYRSDIRAYAEYRFDWNTIMKEYLDIIEEWKEYIKS